MTTFHKTDAEIETQVRDEMRWDCRTEGSPISVTVHNGNVTLSGKVKNYAVKCAAEEAAHRIAGLQSVRNDLEIKIPFGAWKADCEIQQAAKYLFEWDVMIPGDRVTALVAGGWVTLLGVVDCWTQKEEVERAVGRLAGVLGIINHILVQPAEVDTRAACEAIEATLVRQSVPEAKQVQVDMEGGAVRLSGQVPTWNERCAVVTAAGFAPGVRQVVDELKVAVGA